MLRMGSSKGWRYLILAGLCLDAYAVLAYETAYLKRYYNIEFIAAVINNRITNAPEVEKYLTYLRQNGD